MPKRNLIIIHRGPEYQRDFDVIATKVNALDRNITVFHLPSNLKTDIPASAWQHPTLTISLDDLFRIPILRGPIIRSSAVQKLGQQDIFRRNAIPTPPALRFKFGMTLDPILFGEFVVLKTLDLSRTSQGDDVHLFRRRRLEMLSADQLPTNHPVRVSPSTYLVQRFIDTGENPNYFRVSVFLGEILYIWHTGIHEKRAPFFATDDVLERSIVDIKGGTMFRSLVLDDELSSLALRTADAFPDKPLLAIDIVRDYNTGKLWVLEVNAGGNSWHFSSEYGKQLRTDFGLQMGANAASADERGRQLLIEQFGAFDIAARVLTKKTQQLAA